MPRTKPKAFRSPPDSQGHTGFLDQPTTLSWSLSSSSDAEAVEEEVVKYLGVPSAAEVRRSSRRARLHSMSMEDEDSDDGQGPRGFPASASPSPSAGHGASGSGLQMDLSGDDDSTVASPRPHDEQRKPRRAHSSSVGDRLDAARVFVDICVRINGPGSRDIPTQKQIQKAGMDTKWQQLGRNLLKDLHAVVIDTKTRLSDHVPCIGALMTMLHGFSTEAELMAAYASGDLESKPEHGAAASHAEDEVETFDHSRRSSIAQSFA